MQGLREAALLAHSEAVLECAAGKYRRKCSEKFYGERSSIWLEHKIVDLGVAGSIPVAHPIFTLNNFSAHNCQNEVLALLLAVLVSGEGAFDVCTA